MNGRVYVSCLVYGVRPLGLTIENLGHRRRLDSHLPAVSREAVWHWQGNWSLVHLDWWLLAAAVSLSELHWIFSLVTAAEFVFAITRKAVVRWGKSE